jgi:hypothetical protein
MVTYGAKSVLLYIFDLSHYSQLAKVIAVRFIASVLSDVYRFLGLLISGILNNVFDEICFKMLHSGVLLILEQSILCVRPDNIGAQEVIFVTQLNIAFFQILMVLHYWRNFFDFSFFEEDLIVLFHIFGDLLEGVRLWDLDLRRSGLFGGIKFIFLEFFMEIS